MLILGHTLRDHKDVLYALTRLYGISYWTSTRICSRLQIHADQKVSELNEDQKIRLASILTSTENEPIVPMPIKPFGNQKPQSHSYMLKQQEIQQEGVKDPLQDLTIEHARRRQVRADIQRLFNIGSTRGKRHALGQPVKGQSTRRAAKTAKRLNKLNRRGYCTIASPRAEMWTQLASRFHEST